MKMFDADKNRIIGLPYGEKNYDNMLSRYGQTDGRTDRFAISISRVSMLTRDKNVFGYKNVSGYMYLESGYISVFTQV